MRRWHCWLDRPIALGSCVACVVCVLGGCDGDGGGGGGGPDTTAPSVIATNPPDGATDVAVSTAVTATFSEPMAPGTIDETSFLLEVGGAPVAAAVTYSGATVTATCTPAAAMPAGATCTATILSTVEDLAGNPLPANHVWSFTTAAVPVPLWEQLGGQVSAPGVTVEDPTMLVVSSAPAVGYRADSYQTRISLWNGASWNAPTSDPTGGNTNTSIHGTPAFCSTGSAVFMAYSRAGDPAGGDDAFYDRIFVHAWEPSVGWSVFNGGVEVSVPYSPVLGGADAYEPAITCFPGSSEALVAWAEMDVSAADGDDEVWISEVDAGSRSLSPPLERNAAVVPHSSDARTMAIGVRAGGPLFVAHWERSAVDANRTDLYVTSFDGVSYTNIGGVLASDFDINNISVPSMVVTDTDVYVAYDVTDGGSSVKDVYVVRHDGASWTSLGGGPVRAFGPNHFESRAPDLVLADGTLFLAWEEASNLVGPFVFIARWEPVGETWEVDGQIQPQTGPFVIDPNLAYSPADAMLYCAYTELIGGVYRLFVSRRGL